VFGAPGLINTARIKCKDSKAPKKSEQDSRAPGLQGSRAQNTLMINVDGLVFGSWVPVVN